MGIQEVLGVEQGEIRLGIRKDRRAGRAAPSEFAAHAGKARFRPGQGGAYPEPVTVTAELRPVVIGKLGRGELILPQKLDSTGGEDPLAGQTDAAVASVTVTVSFAPTVVATAAPPES